MPRSEAQNEALRERSRDRILDAALTLFARHGYDRTSVRMIAREAGVAQGLLYNYFAGKQDLLLALFERSMQDVRASFEFGRSGLDPHAQLEAYLRGCFAILRRNLDFWQLSYRVRAQPLARAELDGQLREWTAYIQHTLEGYLRAAGFANVAIEATLLFALIDGVSQHYALDPDHYPLDEVVEAIVAKYRRPASGDGRKADA